MSTLSIYDIPLIIDLICDRLSLQDIHACRQVNKDWASLFKPYLWSAIKLTSSDTYEHIDIIPYNKHLIRSLTVTAEHINEVAYLGLTTLQELILYDEDFEHTYDEGLPVSVDAVVTLIDNNKNLWNLGIDLNQYHYYSGKLSPSIMLAIDRHSTLTKLTWHVPEGHLNEEFVECLLRISHNSIEELYVHIKDFCEPFGDEKIRGPEDNVFFNLAFGNFSGQKNTPDYKELERRRLGAPLDHLGPFVLRKIQLRYEFSFGILALLRNCPDLEDFEAFLPEVDLDEVVAILTSCPTLRGVSLLGKSYYGMRWVNWFRQFHQMQRVDIPSVDKGMVQQIICLLAESSRHSLEVLGLDYSYYSNRDYYTSPDDVVTWLETFPNLKTIELGSMRIHIWDVNESVRRSPHIQNVENLDSLDSVVRDWDISQRSRKYPGTILSWWYYWSRDLRFMQALRAQLKRSQQPRLIHMQHMNPIKSFLPRDIGLGYANVAGPWSRGTLDLTMRDVRCLMAEHLRVLRFVSCDLTCLDCHYDYCYGWRYENDVVTVEVEMEEEVFESMVTKSRHRHHCLWGCTKQLRRYFK
ncbi:hypothetical protein BGZ93_000319 [Podila epicladia]|nr:hypothetical protein BGZ92_002208 [Podila epicladia]KAG0086059.1 hypothetical protein BGZ93_000319 [Podila epicladia]